MVRRWTRGSLLVATPLLTDPNFARTVLLMLEHTDEGALGLVLNRPSAMTIADAVPEWVDRAADPSLVFGGGPVQPGAAFVLGERPDPEPATGFAPVIEQIGVVDLQADPPYDLGRVRVFSGYAGWTPGQLEGELAEEAWWVVGADPEDVFCDDPDDLWHDVLARQRGKLSWFANFPDDASDN